MFVKLYGKCGPNPPAYHVINTDLIERIEPYKPLFSKEKYYDISIHGDGCGCGKYVYRLSETEAKKLGDAIGVDILDL